MPHRKAAKLSSISTSREALLDSDDEARTTDWVKSTLRSVHTDVRTSHRNGKKTRFEEEEEEIQVRPFQSYSIASERNHFYDTWLESDLQDEAVFDDHGDYDIAGPPSEGDGNPESDDDIARDESSVSDEDGGPSPVHDLSEFAMEQRLRVSFNNIYLFK